MEINHCLNLRAHKIVASDNYRTDNSGELALGNIICRIGPSVLGFKQRNSVCGIIRGKQKSDGESVSILKKVSRFRSVEIGESEIAYMDLYPI